MIHKSSIIKVKKAIKLLDADIQMIATRIKSKQHKNESIIKHQPLRVVENEVYEFINNNPEYKQKKCILINIKPQVLSYFCWEYWINYSPLWSWA